MLPKSLQSGSTEFKGWTRCPFGIWAAKSDNQVCLHLKLDTIPILDLEPGGTGIVCTACCEKELAESDVDEALDPEQLRTRQFRQTWMVHVSTGSGARAPVFCQAKRPSILCCVLYHTIGPSLEPSLS